jgi:hypothetical protein
MQVMKFSSKMKLKCFGNPHYALKTNNQSTAHSPQSAKRNMND